jgi:hypothetical protein
MRDNLPVMDPKRRLERIETAPNAELKAMVKGSAMDGINPVTGRKVATRPILSGGDGARVRKDYGTGPQMRALLKARWGHELNNDDLKNIGSIISASTGSKRDAAGRLDELFGNWKPEKPLTEAQISVIMEASQ